MKKTMMFVAMFGVMALVLGAGTASAGVVEITTATGEGADAYVRGDNGGTGGDFSEEEYGDSFALVVHGGGKGTGTPLVYTSRIKTWMRFDLSSLTGTVTSASLQLAFRNAEPVAANRPDLGIRALEYELDPVVGVHDGAEWEESTITWNTAPANDINGTPNNNNVLSWDELTGGEGASHLLGEYDTATPPSTVGEYFIVLDGANLIDLINNRTDDLLTFIILGTSQKTYFGWFSKETTYNEAGGVGYGPDGKGFAPGSVAPKLVLETLDTAAPIAEPAGLGLLGLALLGLRKRRN